MLVLIMELFSLFYLIDKVIYAAQGTLCTTFVLALCIFASSHECDPFPNAANNQVCPLIIYKKTQ